MDLRKAIGSKAVAAVYTTNASNRQAYLGSGLFPATKKMGLDLKWIKGNKGLPVSLAPSAFDAVSTIRSREGIVINETEMAFFRESMLLKEKDRQDILRAADANDPYLIDTLNKVFDDADTLVQGAEVVPERMIMQLLTPANGHPSISIAANGSTYAYNYDADGSYATNNFTSLSGTSAWTDHTNSDPIADVEAAQDAVEALTGERPTILIVNSVTMGHIKKNDTVKGYIVANANSGSVMITDARVKELFKTELGVTIVVYNKQFKNESGVAQKFFADGFATLVPNGQLGKTYYGTTPEEADLLSKADVDVSIVNTGVAVTVSTSNDPVQTKTTVSEIVLPSYERMASTYVIKAF